MLVPMRGMMGALVVALGLLSCARIHKPGGSEDGRQTRQRCRWEGHFPESEW